MKSINVGLKGIFDRDLRWRHQHCSGSIREKNSVSMKWISSSKSVASRRLSMFHLILPSFRLYENIFYDEELDFLGIQISENASMNL